MKPKSKRIDHCPEARDEGRDAFGQKQTLDKNPYEKGTPEYREWKRGWQYSKHLATTSKKPSKAALGADAFKRGLTKDANPYEPPDSRYRSWNYGWHLASIGLWKED